MTAVTGRRSDNRTLVWFWRLRARQSVVLDWLRLGWFASLVVSTLVGVALLWNHGLGAGRVLLPIRSVLFESLTDDVAEVEVSEGSKTLSVFRVDPLARVAELRSWLSSAGLAPVVDSRERTATTVGKIQGIVRAFSNPANSGCGEITDLRAKIFWVRAGNGCCSDHTEVFLALAAVAGLQVREVSTAVHTVAEVFVREWHRWIFVDPQYAIMARDSTGRYLSLREMRRNLLGNTYPVYEFFGGKRHIQSPQDRRFDSLYGHPTNFARLTITMGSNVIQVDSQYQTMRWLPKAINQFIGNLSGIRPGYRSNIVGNSQTTIALRKISRLLLIIAVGAICLSLMVYPSVVVWKLVSRHGGT